MTYPQSALTTPSRYRERATYERAAAHEVLDSEFVCHVAFVVDGAPRVLPTLFVRVGETIFLHGSTGATWLLAARAEGLPVVVSIAAVDGLVLARSQAGHSANYRSVVVHGVARPVTDESAKRAAMGALIDKVPLALAGLPAGADVPAGMRRTGHTRPPDTAELARTAVLALDLVDVSVKRRTGGVGEAGNEQALPYWAGVVPLRRIAGHGVPADGVTVPAPAYVPVPDAWHTAATLHGEHVTLEALTPEHTAGLFAALDDPEVWAHMTVPRPRDEAAMAEFVAGSLAADGRVPWIQRDTRTGQIVGTTSYYNINPAAETVAIGHTQIGRPWWRTAINTEAKLLLLGHAFDTLGAGRVEWHTDVRNLRSQAAIERLGATREAVLRRHKRRGDGSWRDTVQYAMVVDDWPAARDRLVARLHASHTGTHAGHH